MRSKKKSIVKHLRDLGIMILVSLVLGFLVSKYVEKSFFNFNSTVLYGIINGFLLWKGNEYIPVFLDKIMPWRKYLVKRLIVNTLASFFFTILLTILISYFWFGILQNLKLETLYAVTINQVIIVSVCIFLGLLTVYSVQFFIYWKEAIKNEEKLKREVLALKYESLKNQVNPHFLFNCLNILTPLVYKDPDEAAKFIKQFSEVYRYVLDQKDNETVDILTEMEFVKAYIYLNKIRFGSSLITDIEVHTKNMRVIPLSIQMLVENAIKHNIITKEQPLHIKIYNNSENYLIVENNLQKKGDSKNSMNMGLANLKSRYEYISDRKFIIEETLRKYIVKIPLIEGQ